MAAPSARTPIAPDARLANLEFVAFDTETTGCASVTGRMVEIGAVRFRLDGTEVERFTRLVNPLRPIPATVTRIHGITNELVRDCPPESEVLPDFLAFLGDPARTLLMAHNARFDMAFVGAALARCGISAPPHAIVDTVRLARRRAREFRSHSLGSLVRCFGIAGATEHRGLADSLALMQVFLSLASKPPEIETAGELFSFAPAWRIRSEGESYRREPAARAPFGRGWTPRESLGTRILENLRPVTMAEPPPVSEPPPATACGDPGFQLAEAISAGRCVSLVYDGGRAAGERRSVTPLRLVTSFEVTYLLAFCHSERKQKQYRLDRVRDVAVE